MLCVFVTLLYAQGLVARVDNPFEQIRHGMKFSAAFDASAIVARYPEARSAIDFLDSLSTPHEGSCYGKVFETLGADCVNADEKTQTSIAMQFLYCFYESCGRLEELPDKRLANRANIEKMKNYSYHSYQKFKLHWRSLCLFARQTRLNELAAEHLISLFEAVSNSSEALEEFSKGLGSCASGINSLAGTLERDAERRAQELRQVSDSFGSLVKYTDDVMTFLEKTKGHIDMVRASLIVIIGVCVVISIISPKWGTSAIWIITAFFASDFAIGRYVKDWDDSWARLVFRIAYVALAIGGAISLPRKQKQNVGVTRTLSIPRIRARTDFVTSRPRAA